MCPDPKCKCQKQFTFTPRQLQMKVAAFKNKIQFFPGTKIAWNMFLRPALNMTAPVIGRAVGATTNNPEEAQATANILKNTFGGKVMS